MKKDVRKNLYVAVFMLVAFLLWTVAVKLVDVRAIGPQGSKVGLATLNGIVHDITGINMLLYNVTDCLSLIPLGVVLGFGILGFKQLIKRKSILKVDRSILALGVFYVAVMALFIFFEMVVVNYRPVLINGCLEASYPSSTTILVMCVMTTSAMQFNVRIKRNALKRSVIIAIAVFTVSMVAVRLISGVHWFSDIVGGALLSAGLVMTYKCFCKV